MHDVIIVGGGPAGLSAALILGRCLRTVLVIDDGRARNSATREIHGFLTRDRTPPAEFRAIAREQLAPYETVSLLDAEVVDADRTDDGFLVRLRDGREHRSRLLLLATGVEDDLPEIEGFGEFYGKSVHHCPYCDGWEWRGQPIAAFGDWRRASGLARKLLTWTRDIVLCTGGPSGATSDERAEVERDGIPVIETPIARLEGRDGLLERIVFADGSSEPRKALFFATGQRQRCSLPGKFDCDFTSKGAVNTGKWSTTNVPGLFVAGDASRNVQLVIIAAAEGAEAAFAMNEALSH